MEIMDWLNPMVEQRSWDVLSLCEEENLELTKRISSNIKQLRRHLRGRDLKLLTELDDLYAQQLLVVRKAYKIGLHDGLNIKNELAECKGKRGCLLTDPPD